MDSLFGDYSTVKVGDEVIKIRGKNAKNYYGWKVTNYNPTVAEEHTEYFIMMQLVNMEKQILCI